MHSLTELTRALRNPRVFKDAVVRRTWAAHSLTTRFLLGRRDNMIPDREWDNLLLLDACRHDVFKEVSNLPGDLEAYYSIASNTSEFIDKTFKNRRFPEIVCVTATPKYQSRGAHDSFHDLIQVWKDHWDDHYRTVLPNAMNREILKAHEKYPNKRILAHYIQPHQPFIGRTGRQLPHQVQFAGETIQVDKDQPNVWDAIRTGKYDPKVVSKAYKENLEIVLPAVESLLDELSGITVVTSDHGNVFGGLRDFGIIGHPRGRHIKNLIKVPWHTYQNGERKVISIDEDATEPYKDVHGDELVKSRLADLGYIDYTAVA